MLEAVDGLRRWSGGVGLTRRQATAAVMTLGRTLRDVFLGPKGRRLLAELDRTALLLMVDETVLHLPWEMMFDADDAPLVLAPFGRVVTTRVTPPVGRDLASEDPTVRILAVENPTGNVHVEAFGVTRRTVLARVEDVPGYGWAAWDPAAPTAAPVTVGGLTLANGIVTVEVDEADGTFRVDGHGPLGRLVDDGDAGDTYNWSPPNHDTFVDAPSSISVSVGETGPVRSSAAWARTSSLSTRSLLVRTG